jgi:hypothetical protein
MRKPSSKSGLGLSLLYILFTIYAVISIFTCAVDICGLVILWPAVPWVYLWTPLVEAAGRFQMFFLLLLLAASFTLNAWIIYQIGKGLGRLLSYKPFR